MSVAEMKLLAFEKLAALQGEHATKEILLHLGMHHHESPFVDGNKRTGYVLMEAMLGTHPRIYNKC